MGLVIRYPDAPDEKDFWRTDFYNCLSPGLNYNLERNTVAVELCFCDSSLLITLLDYVSFTTKKTMDMVQGF